MTLLTQSFEFAASHRLALATLTDVQNYELFGKCANRNGHGHNYRIEVTLRSDSDKRDGQAIPLAEFDRIVHERVIAPFDHKNLNVECEDFSDQNPTVENIARVVFKRLQNQFARAALHSVRVWETPKTSAVVTSDDLT